MHAERLLNVAKACRESPHPEKFTMSCHMHECGTPACAFGHYAARADLQESFRLLKPEYFKRDNGDIIVCAYQGVETLGGVPVCYEDDIVEEHFDLNLTELAELFSPTGCGEAKSPIEAAEYIERFVELNRGYMTAEERASDEHKSAEPKVGDIWLVRFKDPDAALTKVEVVEVHRKSVELYPVDRSCSAVSRGYYEIGKGFSFVELLYNKYEERRK